MFLNISNHKSENWSANQTSEAEKYGEIVDIPFPAVNPRESDKYMDDLVEAYYQKVMEYEKTNRYGTRGICIYISLG